MVSRAQPGNELVAGGGGAEVHEAVAHVAPVKEPENLYVYVIYIYIFEGSLEVKLPTIWTDEKQSRAEAERRERLEERRVEEKE